MKRTQVTLAILLMAGFVLLCTPVAAAPAISTIGPGNPVFIGEQGLDIRAALNGDTILGWWASGAAVTTSAPDSTISVSDPTSFSVSSSGFAGHTGVWYHLASLSKPNGTAFTVMDPQIAVRVQDTTVGVDVTNKWVPTGDDVQIEIDSNLAQMTQRGVLSVPVTIKVQSPDGGIFTSLVNSAGTATPIVDFPVTSTPQYTGPIWNTGNRGTYPPGTYAIWAVCNVNSMNDNYNQEGKTISPQVSLLDQDNNPLIGNKGYVTNPTTSLTTMPTTVPPTVRPTNLPPATTAPIVTSVPETPAPTTETPPPATTAPPAPVTPSPTPTKKSPGFEATLTLAAIGCGMALVLRKD